MTSKKSGRRSSEYEIGYGRPPQSTRWKPGQSGNSRGRPKGSKSLAAYFNRALNEKIVVTERGVLKKLLPRELIVRSLVHKAIKGDLKALFFLLSNEREFNRADPVIPIFRPGMDVAEAAEAWAETRRILSKKSSYGKE